MIFILNSVYTNEWSNSIIERPFSITFCNLTSSMQRNFHPLHYVEKLKHWAPADQLSAIRTQDDKILYHCSMKLFFAALINYPQFVTWAELWHDPCDICDEDWRTRYLCTCALMALTVCCVPSTRAISHVLVLPTILYSTIFHFNFWKAIIILAHSIKGEPFFIITHCLELSDTDWLLTSWLWTDWPSLSLCSVLTPALCLCRLWHWHRSLPHSLSRPDTLSPGTKSWRGKSCRSEGGKYRHWKIQWSK